MKKNAKKALTLLPCLAVLLGGVACNDSTGKDTTTSSNNGSTGDVSYSGEDVTITFWVTFNDSYMQAIENIIEQFNQQPGCENIHIDVVKQTGSYDDLQEMILQGIPANNYPNMALCYPDHVANYLDTGKVVQLDKYMDDETYGWTKADKEDVFDNLVESGQCLQVEGTWCLPFAASTEALFYNATILEGFSLATYDSTINDGKALDRNYFNTLTWEEMFDHLFPALYAALTTNDGNKLYKYINVDSNDYYGLLGYDSDDNLFITLAEQYGYDYTASNTTTGKGEILFNNDGMKGLMKTFNAQYQTGKSDYPSSETIANFPYLSTEGTNGDNYTNSYFVNQGFLFSVGSTGGVKYQLDGNDAQVGVARIPQAEGKEAKQICQGPSICFFDKGDSDAITASWIFYNYLTNTANTCYWGINTGYMPIRESAYLLDDWLELSDETGLDGEDLTWAQVYNLYADITDTLFVSPAFKGSSEARTQAGSIMTQCLLSTNIDADIDKIFEDAENQAKLKL